MRNAPELLSDARDSSAPFKRTIIRRLSSAPRVAPSHSSLSLVELHAIAASDSGSRVTGRTNVVLKKH